MAVGDTVNAIGGLGTTLDFQPAAGVEVVITHIGDINGGHCLYDGVNQSALGLAQQATSDFYFTPKVFINNSVYLRIIAFAATRHFYSGQQTK